MACLFLFRRVFADLSDGGMRSEGELRQSRKRSHSGVSRPAGAVRKKSPRPRERRGEGTPPYGSSPERICPTEGTAGCRDVTPSIRSKSENRGTRPRFSGICKANSIKYVREAHEKRHAKGVPFASLRDAAHTACALPRPILPSARRAGRPAAAGRIKFPVKVGACT